ncbi:hypothetical protein UR09_01455 [Candidatus Nitromaritima sp. SCGC AAA799-A02]|nr:hypothetical protein UR09_01455 [Candidatus Nitromaritima sp. SCGC AAA799-A02]
MKYDLEYVLNSALDGVFIVDKNQRLVLFNRACEELYGISKEDLIEKACWKLQDIKNSWKSPLTHGGKISYGELASRSEQLTLAHKNGREVWVETIYTPIYDQDNGEIAYVMGVIKDITEQKKLEEEKDLLLIQLKTMRKELERKYDFSHIFGSSHGMIQALKLAGEVSRQNTTVFLMGESGTGKELLARAIHYNSPRAGKPFIAINCSAFPDTLIESELFGYEKGAFTGAEKSKPGKIQLALGGSLFLDEITEMSHPAQAKVLRMIQEREFQPLGSVNTLRADIRIIAATNKDIHKLVEEGKFREDLYYRLYVYPITLPPLRERSEDLPLLVERFIEQMNREMGRQITGFSEEAWDVLLNYSWPGNVRELQNLLERLMILSHSDSIGVADLPRYLFRESAKFGKGRRDDLIPNGVTLEEHVRQIESKMILKALKKCNSNKTKAADMLGLSRSTFRYKLSKIPSENGELEGRLNK